jgi:sec-independent protein translocase protein TatC
MRPDGSRDVEMPLVEHLRELRSRLIKATLSIVVATAISLVLVDKEVAILTAPAQPVKLIALEPTEAFVSYVKVALYTGIAISMPLLVYQLFRFLAPGLTRAERRWVLISLPGITLFFAAGLLFCYFVVLPSALGFLLNFGTDVVTPTLSVSKYLSFVTTFLLSVGLAFETPLVIFILSKLGVATPKRLKRFRRWFYVLAFIIAAIITPTPDPVNQTYVAVPIILLYELGLLFARIGTRKPAEAR